MQDKKKRTHHHDTQNTAQHTSQHHTYHTPHTPHISHTTHITHHTHKAHTHHIARTHHHHNTHIAHTPHTRMLGHVHGEQPTVILRRKSECLDMCTEAPPTVILHSIKICSICNVCNFMRTLLFLKLISSAKNYFCFFYLQKWFWNQLTTYICNHGSLSRETAPRS